MEKQANKLRTLMTRKTIPLFFLFVGLNIALFAQDNTSTLQTKDSLNTSVNTAVDSLNIKVKDSVVFVKSKNYTL